MEHLTRVKNALVVMVFCIALAGNVASVEKNEYCFVAEEVETENAITEMPERAIEPEYQYPIVLPLGKGYVACVIESEDIFCVCSGGNYSYIKKSGETVSSSTFEEGYPFSEGLACVKQNGKYGYIDTNGEMVIPCVYDDAAPFCNGLAYFVKGEHYGFMRQDESVAFYLDCDSVSSFQEERAYFCMDGKYGYYDIKGNVVIEPVYSDAGYFKDGVAFVALGGEKGAIDLKGNVLVPIIYDYLKCDSSRGCIVATLDEEEVYYTLSGEEITQEEYKNREPIADVKEQGLTAKFDYDADVFKVYDVDGSEVLSMECDYISHDIYGDYFTNYVLKNYGSDEEGYIVLLDEEENVDLSDVLLKNSITPKQKEYWDMIQENTAATDTYSLELEMVDVQALQWGIKKVKLYDLEQSGELILYCYSEPYNRYMFSQSDSAFFALKDGEAESILFHQSAWTSNYYSEEDLLKYAHLYYNDEGEPYTRETILEAEYVTYYNVNDERVSEEDYLAASEKYKYVSLLD